MKSEDEDLRKTAEGLEEKRRCCSSCDEKQKCHICGVNGCRTCCTDCKIDLKVSIYVCGKCFVVHRKKYHFDSALREEREKYEAEIEKLKINHDCQGTHIVKAVLDAERAKQDEIIRDFREALKEAREAAKIGLSYMRPGEHQIVYRSDLEAVKKAISQAEGDKS